MKCSNCAGEMRYDVQSCSLICESCGTVRPLHRPEEKTYVEETDLASAMETASTDWGITRKLISCKSCGANMFHNSDRMSEICPFCGSSIVLSAQEADRSIAPGAIIPFSITREEVTEKFYRWNKFAFWSPESFRKGKVLGNLTPVYIPFWTFDADTVTTYAGSFGRNTGSGDNEKTVWHEARGILEKKIDDFIVCGSRKFRDDRLLNSVISFRSSELIPYTPDALSGMAAEMYTIGVEEAWKNARNGGIQKDIVASMRIKENADYTKDLKFSTEFSNISFKYVLIPVWLTACKYGGKSYNVVASGHNWKGNCRRPLSIFKIVGTILLLLAYFTLGRILNMPMLFTNLFFLLIAACLVGYVAMFAITFSKQREEEAKKRR